MQGSAAAAFKQLKRLQLTNTKDIKRLVERYNKSCGNIFSISTLICRATNQAANQPRVSLKFKPVWIL